MTEEEVLKQEIDLDELDAASVSEGKGCAYNDGCSQVGILYQGMTECGKAWR